MLAPVPVLRAKLLSVLRGVAVLGVAVLRVGVALRVVDGVAAGVRASAPLPGCALLRVGTPLGVVAAGVR